MADRLKVHLANAPFRAPSMGMPIKLRKLLSRLRWWDSMPITRPAKHICLHDKEYSELAAVSYETRAVAFIDILGWGKAVDDSITSPELRRKLLNAAWFIGTRSKEDAEDDTPDYPSFDQATQFSDTVVISHPYSGYLDLMRLVRQITSYQQTMLSLGFPLRGGIAVGPLYHAASHVFGPALNEAYYMESKLALHPRVIIARSLVPQIEMAAKSLPSHWPFVVKDDDGFYSTDYLMMYAVSESASKRIEQKIDHWLSEHKGDERTFQKYVWLKARWAATKADAGWRAEKSRQLRASLSQPKQSKR
jgi:hypothetical protein